MRAKQASLNMACQVVDVSSVSTLGAPFAVACCLLLFLVVVHRGVGAHESPSVVAICWH